jgi:hypothetical protein
MSPFEVFVELVHRFPDVLGLYDMVAIEDRAGFVTRDQHRNLFRHPRRESSSVHRFCEGRAEVSHGWREPHARRLTAKLYKNRKSVSLAG